MSIVNQSNRPQLLQRLGNITADGTFLLLYAHKAIVIREASIVAHVAVAEGVQANHVAFKLVNRAADGTETDVGAAVTNVNAAVAKGGALTLTVPDDYELERGHSLVLSADVNGTGAFSPCACAVDYEVRGNAIRGN